MQYTQVVMPRPGGPEVLELGQQPTAPPGAGQARIRVEAAGVSFAEVQMLRGRYYAQPKFPFVPGYDLVGRVELTGPGVDPTLAGRRVAAMTRTGAWAHRVVAGAEYLVPVPEEVDAAEAVSLVTNGVTAWQMLHRTAKVRDGQTVLVHGAAGGVGTLLVQLARRAGATVIGTASPGKHDRVRALGATPLDYREPNLSGRVRALAPHGVDSVFDHVAGPGLRESWRTLRRGGVLVAYGSAATLDDKGWRLSPVVSLFSRLIWWSALPNGRRGTFYGINHRNHFIDDLPVVLELLRSGQLRAEVAERLPLAEAPKALGLLNDRAVVGKIVLQP